MRDLGMMIASRVDCACILYTGLSKTLSTGELELYIPISNTFSSMARSRRWTLKFMTRNFGRFYDCSHGLSLDLVSSCPQNLVGRLHRGHRNPLHRFDFSQALPILFVFTLNQDVEYPDRKGLSK